jgi:hypothetical protein
MNRMVSEVLRWQRPPGVRRFSHRWTDWACALIERHTRISVRPPSSPLRLVQPWAPIYRFCQRWEQWAWTISPRINLGISLFLGRSVRQERAAPAAVEIAGPSSHEPAPIRERAIIHHLFENRWLAGGPPGAKPREKSRGTPLAMEVAEVQEQTPLRRVLRRTAFEEENETLMMSRFERESRIAHESRQILRRLLEGRQRVEIRDSRALVMRRQQQAPPPEGAVETGPVTRQSPLGLRVGVPGMAQGSAPGAIDIELLTEKVVRQIDQRIVAYRERMGKLF